MNTGPKPNPMEREHDHLPVALLRIDRTLQRGWVNDAWRTLTGTSQQAVDADAWLVPFHPHDRERVTAALYGVLEGREEAVCEVRASSSDRWYELRMAAKSGRGEDALFVVLLDISDGKEREKTLHFRATRGQLTGLFNRFALMDHMEQALARLERTKSVLGLLLLDLDDFKDVNDRYGHLAGDRVLALFAQRLILTTRQSDVLARFGGDEFVVLCESSDRADSASGPMQRLTTALEEPMRISRDVTVRQTVSAGMSWTRDPTELPSRLIDKADRALLEAKRRKLIRREDPFVSKRP